MLSKWQRISASLIGIGASVAGATAVFISENQAGSTALLLLGALGFLLGITGRVPDRIGKDGVNYDPVDPATKAVEHVLSDDSVPLDIKETIALAIREELDKRQESRSLRTVKEYSNERLSAQANSILFESSVREILRGFAPSGSVFTADVRLNGQYLDGVFELPPTDRDPHRRRIIFEVTTSSQPDRRIREVLSKIAQLRPDGFIFIVNSNQTQSMERRLENAFRFRALSVGLKNVHVVFYDGNKERFEVDLGKAVDRALKAIRDLPHQSPE